MADEAGARAFVAFRERVFDDVSLRSWLHAPLEREAYVARVVAAGAEQGFVFDAEVVRAALREGETVWLTQGCDGA